jgi:hypothetical protein
VDEGTGILGRRHGIVNGGDSDNVCSLDVKIGCNSVWRMCS